MAETATTKPKVTLYWLDKSRSQRIVWLLQECKDVDVGFKIYKRVNKLAPASLKEIHPLGKSPVVSIEAPATPKPIVLAESGALCEYLCDHFAQHLVPKRYQEGKEGQVGGETEEWLRFRFYMHYAEGSLMPLFVLALFFEIIVTGSPFFIKPITKAISGQVWSSYLTPNFNTNFGFLESQLETSPGGGEFLCGKDLTAADIMMSFALISDRKKIDKAKFPKLYAYSERLEAHPGYQASVKKIEEVTGEPAKALL